MLKLLKSKKFLIVSGIVLVIIALFVLYIFNHKWIVNVIGALVATGLSIGGIKITAEALDDKIANEKIRKVRYKDEVKNNTTDDNYKFGVSFIKRRRNKK